MGGGGVETITTTPVCHHNIIDSTEGILKTALILGYLVNKPNKMPRRFNVIAYYKVVLYIINLMRVSVFY